MNWTELNRAEIELKWTITELIKLNFIELYQTNFDQTWSNWLWSNLIKLKWSTLIKLDQIEKIDWFDWNNQTIWCVYDSCMRGARERKNSMIENEKWICLFFTLFWYIYIFIYLYTETYFSLGLSSLNFV